MFDLPPYPHTHMQAHPIQKLKKVKYSLVPEFVLSYIQQIQKVIVWSLSIILPITSLLKTYRNCLRVSRKPPLTPKTTENCVVAKMLEILIRIYRSTIITTVNCQYLHHCRQLKNLAQKTVDLALATENSKIHPEIVDLTSLHLLLLKTYRCGVAEEKIPIHPCIF